MITWGIVGAGNMGRVFAESIKEVNNAKLIAVASKNNQNLESFSNDFAIDKELRFSSYENICENDSVDAIYISTLNNTHLDLIKICAKNKKNILCEKPFCLNFNEALEVKKIVEENDIKFFEAIAYISHPQTISILELIDNMAIGKIKSIESSYGFKSRIKPDSRLFNRELGGGAILDVGCYPLSFINLFSNKESEIEFKNIRGVICDTQVDIAASAELLINNDISCNIKVSLKEYLKNESIIYGSRGKIIIHNPWSPEKKTFLEIFNDKRNYKHFIESDLSIFANQIKNVSNKFLNQSKDETKLFDISRAVENMKNLDYWKKNINRL